MPQVYDTCFLFGAGPFFGLPVPPQPGDLILAADGGYRHCAQISCWETWTPWKRPPKPSPCKPSRQKRTTPIPCWL